MDNQVEVKIKGTVITAQYGTLSDGTILRTNAAFAKHLVEDCNAAEYVNTTPKEEKTVKAESAKPTGKPRAKKSATVDSVAEQKAEIEAQIVQLEADLAAAEESAKPAIQAALTAAQEQLAELG